VVQAKHLGTIYTNSLLKLNVCAKIISIADDTVVLVSNKTIVDLYDSAINILKIDKNWFDNNFLELNSSKSNYIFLQIYDKFKNLEPLFMHTIVMYLRLQN